MSVASVRAAVALCAFYSASLFLLSPDARAATLTWSGGGDGFTWLDEDNWTDDLGVSPAVPPGVADDVVIAAPGAEVHVNGPAGAATLQVDDALLRIDSELTVAASAMVNRMRLAGDVINADEFVILGNSEWKNGRFLGNGDVVNQGEFTVDGGIARLIQSKLFRNDASMIVDTAIDLEAAAFENAGQLTLGSSLAERGMTPSTLTNTGAITADADVGAVAVALANVGGTLEAKGAASAVLELNRAVNLQGGVLSLADDATIILQGFDSHTVSGIVDINGTGNVTLRTSTTVDSFVFNNADGSKGLEIISDVDGNGTIVNNQGGKLLWGLGAKISLFGGVDNQGVATLAGSIKRLETSFNNSGTVDHANGSLLIETDGDFFNEPGGTYRLFDGAGVSITGPGVFVNEGTLEKQGAGVVNISSGFNLAGGSVDVNQGELRFNGIGASDGGGAFNVAGGALLAINGGQQDFDGDYTVQGDGTFQVSSGGVLKSLPGATVSINLPSGGWSISSQIQTGGNVVNQGQATWIGSTITTTATGGFANEGDLMLDIGNSRTLAGPGQLINRSNVEQLRSLNLEGAGGGIENENGATWAQASNITFAVGSLNKSVSNAGTWRFTGDSTVFDPAGAAGGNVFGTSGALVVESDVTAVIHSEFSAEDAAIRLNRLNVFGHKTRLSLTGGGQIANSPVTLQFDTTFELLGNGSPKVYLFQGPAAEVNGDSIASEFRIGPGALVAAASPLTLNVRDVGSGNRGTVLDGGSLSIGNVVNQRMFNWRSGDIGATLTNSGTLKIETSGSHNVTADLTNASGGDVRQRASLRIDASASPTQVIVENQGDWFMDNGAVVTSQQPGGQALFKNTGFIKVRPQENGSPTFASIDAAFQNLGGVIVGAPGDVPATLNVTAKTGAVNSQGELVSGTWVTSASGFIDFARPITTIAGGAKVFGTTTNIPQLSTLNTNKSGGRLVSPRAELEQDFGNAGEFFFGKNFENPDVELVPVGRFRTDGILRNQSGGKTDSAVDQSDGVSPLSVLAFGHDGDTPHEGNCEMGCELPEVAIDVGAHQFINAGLVRPGGPDDPGAFPLIGDFVQEATGILEVDLNGLVPIVEYDQSIIYGNTELAGTLEVMLLGEGVDRYAPELGDAFDLITATDVVAGRFDQVLLPELDGGLGWAIDYDISTVTLEVVDAGDFTANGAIGGDDFLSWQRGESPNPLSPADLAVWQNNFGANENPANSASAAIPEPAAWITALFGAAVCCMATRLPSRYRIGNLELARQGCRHSPARWSRLRA